MAFRFVSGAFALATFSVITGNQDVLEWPVILGSDAWLYCVPERSAEKHGKTDLVKEAGWEMYIERKEADGTWTYVAGAERSNSTSEWRVMVAAGSRYKMFGHGFLGIQNISKSDNNTLYKCTISGSDSIHGVYMEPFEVKLCVMEAKAVQETSDGNLTSPCNCSDHKNFTSPVDLIEPPKEISNANLTSLCNCSEHSNCTSPMDHIQPPKEISNANLTSLCNCSEHSNCTSPMDHIQPPKVDGNWSPWYYWSECSTSCGGGVQRRARFCTNPPAAFGGKPCAGESLESRGCNSTPCSDLQKHLHILLMVGFAVVLVIWLLRPLVNIARGIVFIIRQLYTASPAQAVPAQAVPAQAVPAQAVPAQAQVVVKMQGNGGGKMSEHETYSFPETSANSDPIASWHTCNTAL